VDADPALGKGGAKRFRRRDGPAGHLGSLPEKGERLSSTTAAESPSLPPPWEEIIAGFTPALRATFRTLTPGRPFRAKSVNGGKQLGAGVERIHRNMPYSNVRFVQL